MPNHFKFLAEYNRKANLELFAILDREDPAILRKQTGIYFKSILGTLSHILLSDIAWLGRLIAKDEGLRVVVGALPAVGLPGVVDKTWQDWTEFRSARDAVDAAYAKLIQALPEGRFEETFHYQNLKGEPQSKPLWVILEHLFNHQTHHRGQIATLLDQAGIANDYSGLAPKFE
jgi:uncharacterized damage-inducible protein DinB